MLLHDPNEFKRKIKTAIAVLIGIAVGLIGFGSLITYLIMV